MTIQPMNDKPRMPFRGILIGLLLSGIVWLAIYGGYHLAFVEHPKYCFDNFVNPLTGE